MFSSPQKNVSLFSSAYLLLLGIALLFSPTSFAVDQSVPVEPVQPVLTGPALNAALPASAPVPSIPTPTNPVPDAPVLPVSAPSASAPPKPEPSAPDLQSVPGGPELLPGSLDNFDAPRNYVSEKFIGFVTEVDRFFGGERNFQETNSSVVQLEWLRMVGPGTNDNAVLAGRVKVTLPETEKRMHLLLETDPDKQATSVQSQGQSVLVDPNAPSKPESYSAALRFESNNPKDSPWYLSGDAGMDFQGITPHLFARSRGSYSMPLADWRFKATESVSWFNTTGAVETSQLDFEHLLSESVLFRATSSATWIDNQQTFNVRQDFSGYHTLPDGRALLYQASVIGTSQPQWQTTDFVMLMLYRQRLHRSWTYFELSPQLHFPQTNNYHINPQLMLRLEVLFDQSR